jgi:hypothetical protein
MDVFLLDGVLLNGCAGRRPQPVTSVGEDLAQEVLGAG